MLNSETAIHSEKLSFYNKKTEMGIISLRSYQICASTLKISYRPPDPSNKTWKISRFIQFLGSFLVYPDLNRGHCRSNSFHSIGQVAAPKGYLQMKNSNFIGHKMLLRGSLQYLPYGKLNQIFWRLMKGIKSFGFFPTIQLYIQTFSLYGE